MKIGYRDTERFWIAVTVRFAFGIMFLIAAMRIFTYYDTKDPPADPGRTAKEYFAESLTNWADDMQTPYESTWINFKWFPLSEDPVVGASVGQDLGITFVWWFLVAMPFVFLILAFLLLTGLGYRLALRLSAIYLVLLGLGKYIVGDSQTTANDFIFAAFICIALFLTAREPEEDRSYEDPTPAV